MTDVFISYAREDRVWVEKLASALHAEGVAVWWDKKLAGGANFSQETETRLNEAKAILVAWSKVSVSSMWVGDEATVGREKGNLVPVAIDAVAPKIGFRGIHTIDLSGWNGGRGAPEFNDLVHTLKTRISGEVPPMAPAQRRRWWARPPVLAAIGVGAVLVVGAAFFAARSLIAPATTSAATTPAAKGVAVEASAASIAVLPFADMSPAKDQEYFADGMAEEILNVLARVEGLTVASRTSSFAFKTQPDAKAPAIARDLGVRHILEGSVRKAGDTVRITVQLIDTGKDAHLWSETFDRPLTTKNLFAIQDEIAKAVVGALREKIGVRVGATAAATERTGDVDAYGMFLQARAKFQARRDLNKADRLLEEALKRDPRFADALAIRAAVRLGDANPDADFGDPAEARARGRAFAQEALAINPNNSLAMAALAQGDHSETSAGRGTVPYATTLSAFDRALALDPTNANALHWKGQALDDIGDIEGAALMHRRCIEVDSALAPCRMYLTSELLILGRRKEAEAVFDDAANAGVLSAPVPHLLISLVELQRREAFRLLAANIPALRGWHDFDGLYAGLSDPRGDHRALAAKLKALYDENGSTAGGLLNALGNYEGHAGAPARWSESLRTYRQSPEFKQRMRAIRVYEYWKAHGFPPQCRAVGKDDFACDR